MNAHAQSSSDPNDRTLVVTDLMPPRPYPSALRANNNTQRDLSRPMQTEDNVGIESQAMGPQADAAESTNTITPSHAAGYATAEDPGAIVHVLGRYSANKPRLETFVVPAGTSFEVGCKPGTPFADDPFMHRFHAALMPVNDGVLVEDYGTPNGVFTRIDVPITVEEGDQFRVGNQLLRLRHIPAAPPAVGGAPIGSPDPGYWLRIDMMLRPSILGASHPISDVQASVGQKIGHVRFPDDAMVSDDHCRFYMDGKDLIAQDMGSRRGTWIRVHSGQVIPHGSTLLIGDTMIGLEASAKA